MSLHRIGLATATCVTERPAEEWGCCVVRNREPVGTFHATHLEVLASGD